jgi:hypothetical protein
MPFFFLHAPAPSHVLSPVQLFGSSRPATFSQRAVVLEHTSHGPHWAFSQQAPSTQAKPSQVAGLVQVPESTPYSQVSFSSCSNQPPKRTPRLRCASYTMLASARTLGPSVPVRSAHVALALSHSHVSSE